MIREPCALHVFGFPQSQNQAIDTAERLNHFAPGLSGTIVPIPN